MLGHPSFFDSSFSSDIRYGHLRPMLNIIYHHLDTLLVVRFMEFRRLNTLKSVTRNEKAQAHDATDREYDR